jgi:site-specific recombinase XerD
MKPPNAGHTYPAEILSRDEIHALMRCLGYGISGDRYRAAVVLMYRSGLRVAEALALLPKDVDLAAGTVTVLHGKGDRRRVVGIDPEAGAVIEKWLRGRRRLGVGPGRPLICTITRPHAGQSVYASVLREALKDAAVRAGIEKRVHPHGFRHAFASELAREKVGIRHIQRLLGHKSIATTERYLGGLTPWEAIDAVRGRGSWAEVTPAALGPPDLAVVG